MLGWPSMKSKYILAQVKMYFDVVEDPNHSLHNNLDDIKGIRIMRGDSWMLRAENSINTIIKPTDLPREPQWRRSNKSFTTVTLPIGKEYRDWEEGRADKEIKNLINGLIDSKDAVIYTDGSVIRNQRSIWGFTAEINGQVVKENSQIYNITTSSMRMEIEAVTGSLEWVCQK